MLRSGRAKGLSEREHDRDLQDQGSEPECADLFPKRMLWIHHLICQLALASLARPGHLYDDFPVLLLDNLGQDLPAKETRGLRGYLDENQMIFILKFKLFSAFVYSKSQTFFTYNYSH